MTRLRCDDSLVVLNVPQKLEELVVDWLLAREGGTGFTSFPVFGHGAGHDGLSPAEQVRGRQQRHQFQIQISGDDVDSFLDDARKALGTVGVHFWVLPLAAGGHLGASS